MLFSELYSAYYKAVAEILRLAVKQSTDEKTMRDIVAKHAFSESNLTIPQALKNGSWPLMHEGRALVKKPPEMPLTKLQKSWLNALALDKRALLFEDEPCVYPEITPLFTPEDFEVFDKYLDGDDYDSAEYRANFRLILNAIKSGTPLYIEQDNRRGRPLHRLVFPERLEYSEKDDKFRLIGRGSRFGNTVNLGRIKRVYPAREGVAPKLTEEVKPLERSVTFEVCDERNALERVMLHFAHFKKQAERIDREHYRVTVFYDKEDETELVIRILSFGPMVNVTAPTHFVNLIKERLIQQKSCELI